MANGRAVGCRIATILLGILACAAGAAEPREQRVPLRDGMLHVPDLSAAVMRGMELPNFHLGNGADVAIQSPKGAALIEAVNLSLGQAGHVHRDGNALVLRIDPDKVPTACEKLSRAMRVLAAETSPDATLRQARRWGLFVPNAIDPSRPLIVLIHGLDSTRGMLGPMGDLLSGQGYQVAYFAYPGDQSIDDSAAMLAHHLRELRTIYPSMRIDIIAHSMGGLVARDYIENTGYAGGVDRLILIGTPNGGSSWSSLRFALSLEQNYQLWRNDPDWSLSWYLTEGFGEAGRELTTGSAFLKKMRGLSRRTGVRYTIIAGTQHPASRLSAECCESMAGWFSGRVGKWWGFRQCKSGLNSAAGHYRHNTGDGDGPVAVTSAQLAGVSDEVRVPADHIALFCPIEGHPPAAWEAVRNRLAMK